MLICMRSIAWKIYTILSNHESAGSCKWLSIESALKLLLEVKPSVDRVGPFVVIGLLPDSAETSRLRTTSTLHCQVIYILS